MVTGPVPPRPPQTAAELRASDQRYLAAARETFPGWDFHELRLEGWLAVPRGTPVVRSVDIDGIVEKLRALAAAGSPDAAEQQPDQAPGGA